MTTIARGAVRTSERALAPDLARGFALLFIALANAPYYLWGAQETGMTSAHPKDAGLLDSVVQAVTIVVIDGRTYPLFAFLFGYGIVQLHRRQLDAGTDERAARRLLQRRNLWLIAFGLVHAALLWMGDVLGAYGLAGLVFVGLFLLRRDRTLLVWAGILTGLLAFFAASSIVGGWAMSGLDLEDVVVGPSLTATQGEPNYLAAMAQRVGFWILLVFGQGLLSLVVPVMILLAFWAARRGILERPLEHARLLRGVAIAGIAIGWLGGVPGMLVHVGAIDIPDHASWLFAGLSSLTGAAAGLGYAALFGLLGGAIARRRAARQDPPRLGFTGAVVAVGRRSLSCYLLQSVLCAPVLAAWGLGLGARFGSAEMALFAAAVWAATVLFAAVCESRGWRGPAETLLRRLVYRR